VPASTGRRDGRHGLFFPIGSTRRGSSSDASLGALGRSGIELVEEAISACFLGRFRNIEIQNSACETLRLWHSMFMSASPHILVVEDDREIANLVTRFLKANDCRVAQAANGREMDLHLTDGRFDLIVLDLMLPGEDGLAICRRLRRGNRIPIIMLTAKGDPLDRIIGLEMGADDYIAKPFDPRELLARIRAVLRRVRDGEDPAGEKTARRHHFAGYAIDVAARRLSDPQGAEIALTGAEFDLLLVLVERPGRVLSRDRLLDLTQGRAAGPFERSVDILVSRIRRKMEQDPHHPEIIKTVRSGGYMFTADVESS
jgi:two-component system OmpR family response regulator